MKFENYSKSGRGVIFHARLEAGTYGSPLVEPEHLLLGLLREFSKTIEERVDSPDSLKILQEEMQASFTTGTSFPTYVEVPLSDSSSHILTVAAEEAARHSHKVGTEHILLAILQEEKCPASRALRAQGMKPFEPHEDGQKLDAGA